MYNSRTDKQAATIPPTIHKQLKENGKGEKYKSEFEQANAEKKVNIV